MSRVLVDLESVPESGHEAGIQIHPELNSHTGTNLWTI